MYEGSSFYTFLLFIMFVIDYNKHQIKSKWLLIIAILVGVIVVA